MIDLTTAQKRPFLDTKSAIERARQLKMQRTLFVVMSLCPLVVLSYLDAGFEPQSRHKGFLTACLLLVAAAAKICYAPLDPKRWWKT